MLFRSILSDGLSSRLHRSLVYEQQIAQSVGIRYHSSEVAGQFVIDATPSNPEDIGRLEAAVDEELKRIWTNPPTDDEIARVKNRLEAQHFRQLTRIGGFGGRADALNYYNVFAKDPNLINTEINEYMSVTREDILRVYEEVLNDKQVRLKVLPEPVLKQQISKLDRTVKPDSTGRMDFVAPIPQKQTLSKIEQAEAGLASLQANFEKIRGGTREEDKKQAQALVDRAKANLTNITSN